MSRLSDCAIAVHRCLIASVLTSVVADRYAGVFQLRKGEEQQHHRDEVSRRERDAKEAKETAEATFIPEINLAAQYNNISGR